jgi:uncharacterized protein (DUF305 family)
MGVLTGVRAAAAVALAALALAAGCGDDESGPSGDVRANGTDAAFAQAMIPLHESGVDAADLALSRAEHRQLEDLAFDIVQTRSVELSTLRGVRDLLDQAGVEPGDLGAAAGSEAKVDTGELRNSSNFDCDFIAAMIPLNESEIRLARAELGDGIHAELRRMSENIIDTESYEIRQLRRFQRRWC